MRTKIFESLKQTYGSKYGVSDEILQGYAESLAATGLVTEDNLATVIQGQDSALKEFQRGFDKLRTENTNYKKQLDELSKRESKKEDHKEDDKVEDTPAWAKAILEKQQALEQKFNASDLEKQLNTRKSILESALKDAPETFRKSTLGDIDLYASLDEDKFNARVEQIKQTATDLSLQASSSRPYGANRTSSGEASEEELKKVASAMGIAP